MNSLWAYAVLRLIAQALRAGDSRTAGEQLDAELDGMVEWVKGVLRSACGCYVWWVILCLVGGVIWAVVDIVGYWLRRQ